VASVVTGVFGGLTQSLAAMTGFSNQRSGVESSAFSSISQSFTKMKPNQPQNLKTINNDSAEKTELLSNQDSQTNTSVVSTIVGGAVGAALGNQVGGGSGRVVATAAGAVAGSLIGSNLTRKPRKSAVPSEASGVSNLPGGEKVLSMVKEGTDAAKNALPGTAQLKGAIDSQTTDKVNNLTTSTSSKFSSVKDAVTAKLSVAEKAQLASGLSSIATQGKKKIKLPTVSTNTVDRSKITSSTKSLLGDSRIPEPDFSGEPNKSKDTNPTASTNSPTALASKLSSANSEINKIKQQAAELSNLERNSLAGDPEIKRKKDEIQNKLTSLVDEKEQIEIDVK
jgi:outer membrane lipoprotein SlyB